jgi:hypothetical protein
MDACLQPRSLPLMSNISQRLEPRNFSHFKALDGLYRVIRRGSSCALLRLYICTVKMVIVPIHDGRSLLLLLDGLCGFCTACSLAAARTRSLRGALGSRRNFVQVASARFSAPTQARSPPTSYPIPILRNTRDSRSAEFATAASNISESGSTAPVSIRKAFAMPSPP